MRNCASSSPGEWEHAGRDAEAVNALVDAGCDVITCHLDSPRVVTETAEARGVNLSVTPSIRRRSRPRATSPAPNIGGQKCSRTLSRRSRRAGRSRTSSPAATTRTTSGRSVRRRRERRGDQRRNDRDRGNEERRRHLRRPPQRQHRQAGDTGRNGLWTLCRRAAKDRLPDRWRHRLAPQTGKQAQLTMGQTFIRSASARGRTGRTRRRARRRWPIRLPQRRSRPRRPGPSRLRRAVLRP